MYYRLLMLHTLKVFCRILKQIWSIRVFEYTNGYIHMAWKFVSIFLRSYLRTIQLRYIYNDFYTYVYKFTKQFDGNILFKHKFVYYLYIVLHLYWVEDLSTYTLYSRWLYYVLLLVSRNIIHHKVRKNKEKVVEKCA